VYCKIEIHPEFLAFVARNNIVEDPAGGTIKNLPERCTIWRLPVARPYVKRFRKIP